MMTMMLVLIGGLAALVVIVIIVVLMMTQNRQDAVSDARQDWIDRRSDEDRRDW